MASATDLLREQQKECLFSDREKKRDDFLNKLRNLEKEKSSTLKNQFDITSVALKLRKKPTAIDIDSLVSLKNAFVENPSLSVEFLKVEGSMHSLTTLIIGKDPYLQLLSLECCCNLSLGDKKTCYQVAKSVGPYMMSILRGINYNIMATCLLTVGNLAGSDMKTWHLLMSQGVLECILNCVSVPQVTDSAAYALFFITKSGVNEIEKEQLEMLVKAVVPFFHESTYFQWTLYHCTLSTKCLEILLKEGVTELALKAALANPVDASKVQSVTGAVRILANMAVLPTVASFLLDRWDSIFSGIKVYYASEYRHLRKESLWLFANLYYHASSTIQEQARGLAGMMAPLMTVTEPP